jgi:hypothetical protein
VPLLLEPPPGELEGLRLGLPRGYGRRRLLAHYLMISDIAGGRPINAIERRLYRAAARDPVVQAAFERIGSRRRSPSSMLRPGLLAHIARAQSAPQPSTAA